MKRQAFERLVERVVARIPAEFRQQLHNLSFQVEDWADGETLAEVGFDDARDLLGFYRGWPLSERGSDYGNCLPDVIVLYQGAIEDYVAATGEPLLRVIRETLIHELAHYFGFTEEQMDAIEDLWARGGEADGPGDPA